MPFTDWLQSRVRAGRGLSAPGALIVGSSLCPNISSSAVGGFVTFVPGQERGERRRERYLPRNTQLLLICCSLEGDTVGWEGGTAAGPAGLQIP